MTDKTCYVLFFLTAQILFNPFSPPCLLFISYLYACTMTEWNSPVGLKPIVALGGFPMVIFTRMILTCVYNSDLEKRDSVFDLSKKKKTTKNYLFFLFVKK